MSKKDLYAIGLIYESRNNDYVDVFRKLFFGKTLTYDIVSDGTVIAPAGFKVQEGVVRQLAALYESDPNSISFYDGNDEITDLKVSLQKAIQKNIKDTGLQYDPTYQDENDYQKEFERNNPR